MYIGLEITDQRLPRHAARARVTLESSTGQVVVAEDNLLGSRARPNDFGFYTVPGEIRYVRIRDGVTLPELVAQKASGGWGSSFIADPRESYTLSVEIVNPESALSGTARVLVKGGAGWDLGS
jgi:hypothetical protein